MEITICSPLSESLRSILSLGFRTMKTIRIKCLSSVSQKYIRGREGKEEELPPSYPHLKESFDYLVKSKQGRYASCCSITQQPSCSQIFTVEGWCYYGYISLSKCESCFWLMMSVLGDDFFPFSHLTPYSTIGLVCDYPNTRCGRNRDFKVTAVFPN